MNKKELILRSAVIGLKLLLICTVVALIVSLVYSVTLEQYEKNLTAAKNEAIGEIFGQTGLNAEETEENSGVYTVTSGTSLYGYCVEIVTEGYGGEIQMMVGFSAAREVLGVSIISQSETPGLGAKVAEPEYLSQYVGKSGTLELGRDIDAIGGATYSSGYVLAGVNRAAELLQAQLDGGEK